MAPLPEGGEGFKRMNFEWDENKEKANLEKDGVSFDEAKTVFGDPIFLKLGLPKLFIW
jgi:hypothetical protein